MACDVIGTQRKFMEESMVKVPSDLNPGTIPPPYDFHSIAIYLIFSEANLLRFLVKLICLRYFQVIAFLRYRFIT